MVDSFNPNQSKGGVSTSIKISNLKIVSTSIKIFELKIVLKALKKLQNTRLTYYEN